MHGCLLMLPAWPHAWLLPSLPVWTALGAMWHRTCNARACFLQAAVCTAMVILCVLRSASP